MNKLSKTQRERLMAVAIGTAALMAALWYLVVQPKQTELTKTRREVMGKLDRLAKAEIVLKNAGLVRTAYTNQTDELQLRENQMTPERGAYEWIISTINPFIQSRKGVNIVTFSEPTISDQGLLPKFPYKWATFHIKGVGYYQEFAKFFADFENSFPYFRIQNLDISGNTGPAADEEKLGFAFDIITPVAPVENK